MRIFLAGATGAIGRRLVPLLVADGHAVTGTTRSRDKVALVEALGAKPAIVDAFDRAAVIDAVGDARPDVVIHQLTDLPQAFDATALAAASAGNARLRREGTRNLVDAALAAGVRRLVAQSIAFVYAPGAGPHGEEDPLDGSEAQAVSVGGVRALEDAVASTPGLDDNHAPGIVHHHLEDAVASTPGLDGLVLRYGRLYGPGTWRETEPGQPPAVHGDAAAAAALLAVTRGAPGIYNIADEDGAVSIAKARRELGFDPAFRVRE
ncbi:MAG: NAD(P)-dependent oxidoreductase [Rhizobiales bacterium]|nr:NAD(P)-dependent oxidoreductase [Hyphomicrobiales bacterium]